MRAVSSPTASPAFDWLMAVLAALIMAGVIQDGWAHAHGLVDQSFFTPWHAILYSCMALSGIVLAIVGVLNLRRGYSFRNGLPYGYWTSAIGVVLFLTGGVFDLVWHTLWGIETDITGLISISHLWLALGGALVMCGPIRSVANRSGLDAGGWRVTGPVVLCTTALLTLLGFFTQYASLLGDDTSERIMAPNVAGTTGGELFSVSANGTHETRLLTFRKHDIWGAAVSSDGNHVTYRVQNTSGGALPPSDIYVASVDGSHAVRVTHSGRHDTQAAWSPDGRRLAYVSMPAGTSGSFSIVVINRDGTGAQTVVNGTTTVQNPSWSPDGRWIVFQSRNGLHQQLAIIPSTGGAARWLPATDDANEPFWARTGQIVFDKSDGSLWLTDISGQRAQPLHLSGSEPEISPDGTRVAYAQSADGAAQIFIAGIGASPHAVNVTQLAAQDASHPAWASNSALLFTATGRPPSIYTSLGKGYSIDAVVVSALISIGLVLFLVRRWRLPFGSITLLFGLSAIALATQSDTYWDIPSAIVAGVFADVLIAVLRERVRAGNGFYAFAFAVPFVLTAAYEVCVALYAGGMGWPPNMIIGAPFIAGFVGLLVSFCFAIPLPVPPAQTRTAAPEVPVPDVALTI